MSINVPNTDQEEPKRLYNIFHNPIYVADDASFESAIQILESDVMNRSKRIESFRDENKEAFELLPVHTNEAPILFRFPQSPVVHSVYMWIDYDDENNVETTEGKKIPDFSNAIAIICNLTTDENGKVETQVPVAIMVGEKFEGVLEYNISDAPDSTSGLNALIFLINKKGEMTYHTRDALSTPPEMKEYFEKRMNDGPRGHGIFCSSEMIRMIYGQHKKLDVTLDSCPRQMFSPITRMEPS